MSKTNSNSITSIFIAALNENSTFRKRVIKIFENKLDKEIDSSVKFYDCTHSPLLYKEMNGKEIDIIAQIPGKHKPVMMIEIKANTREPLQDSQRKDGEYEITSRKRHIPLIYIIPKNYIHEKEIPRIAKKITWESIIERAEDVSVSFNEQINNFVEIVESEEEINPEEITLFSKSNYLLEIHELSVRTLKIIEKILKRNRRKDYSKEEDQWGVGYFYKFQGIWYYLGFVPPFDSYENGKYFLSLAITENCNNCDELEHLTPTPIYFEEGYYYLSILDDKTVAGDKKVISEIRKELKDVYINRNIRKYFKSFYSLRSKLGENEFDILFDEENYGINEKEYIKLKEKLNI